MSLWAVWSAMVKRPLERARNFEREQERRLLEAYARGRKRRRENKGRDRERERIGCSGPTTMSTRSAARGEARGYPAACGSS
jgi:hypothetical protein